MGGGRSVALFFTTFFQACHPGPILFAVGKAIGGGLIDIIVKKLKAITHFPLWVIFTCLVVKRTVAILLAVG